MFSDITPVNMTTLLLNSQCFQLDAKFTITDLYSFQIHVKPEILILMDEAQSRISFDVQCL